MLHPRIRRQKLRHNRLARRSNLRIESLESRELMAYDTTVLADSPVAYYRFEEAAGATVAANQGTLGAGANGAINNVAMGQASALPGLGNAGTFSNGNIRIPDQAGFDLGTGDYTIEFWMNSSQAGRGDIFTYKGGGGDMGIHYASNGGNVASLYHDGFRVNTPGVLAPNTWYHVAIVRSGTGTNEATIFVNGVPAASGTSAQSLNIAQDLLIGSNHNNDAPTLSTSIPFVGKIDEFAIYNKALSTSQIRTHIEAAFGAYRNLPIQALNPSLYYSFSEPANSLVINDISGDGHNGTVINGANQSVSSASLQMGTAIDLNGSNQYVVTTGAAALGFNGSFTASAWIRPDAIDGDRTIFGTDETGDNIGLHLILRDGQPHMGFYGNDLGSGTTLSVGEWYHVTWRYDATIQEQSIWLNGAQIARRTGAAQFVGTGNVNIGRWAGGRYFDGKIDEAAIFNSALPSGAILALYETATQSSIKNDVATATENGVTNLAASALLGNDEGIPGGITSVTAGTPGTSVSINPDGSVTFNPGTAFDSLPAGAPGTATFTYQSIVTGDYGNRRIVLGPFGPNGTYNAYMFDPLPKTWDEARVSAYSTKLNGKTGQLVAVNSLAENNFLANAFRNQDSGATLDFWLGISDSDQRSAIDLQQLVGVEAGTGQLTGWKYVNGDQITFSNWGGGEPNDSGGEDATHMRGDGLWNDHQAGSSIGQPDHQLAAVYEFELGITDPSQFVAPGFTVRQVRSNAGVGDLNAAEALLAPGSANNIGERTMTYGVVNLSGDGDGRFSDSLPYPFAGNGENFAVSATGFMYIPAAGRYTFIVNSDDGFRLSITGATLETVGGQAGTVNLSNTLAFTAGRGAEDSLGVFNFPAPGFYQVQLNHWEGGGGDSIELSAAPGIHTQYNSAFSLVGDIAGLKVFNQVPTSLMKTASVTLNITGVNDVPVAGTVAAQTINEGSSVTFTVTGASDADAGTTLQYEWDLDGNGTFEQVASTSNSITLTEAQLLALGIDGPYTGAVTARISDGITSVTAASTLTVSSVAPTGDLSGPIAAAPGMAVTFDFSATDPSDDPALNRPAPGKVSDTVAGFTFTIDWGDNSADTVVSGVTSGSSTHTYTKNGNYTVTLTVRDRDNATSTTTAEISISQVYVDDEGNLIINGTGAADRIVLSNSANGLQARINNVLQKAMSPEGGVVRILGFGGNDNITVQSNVSYPVEVFGGAGNDYIAGGTQDDLLDGGDGNDRVLGGGGNDTILGGDGNDTLSGGAGDDEIYGDAYLDEDGIMQDGTGNDTINGDAGNDTADGGAGNDKVNGGTGNDFLYGQDGNDRMDGGAQDDLIMGNNGSDSIYGQQGNDVLVGGDSGDLIYGGAGDDLILGDDMDPTDAQDLFVAWAQNFELPEDILPTLNVVSDGAPDNLYGQGGADWFLAFLNDRVKDANPLTNDRVDRDAV